MVINLNQLKSTQVRQTTNQTYICNIINIVLLFCRRCRPRLPLFCLSSLVTDRDRDTETHRERERKTDRQTDRETDRQAGGGP